MKEYNVYLFDLDGTLIDSEESLYDVFILSFKKVGLSIDESCVRHLMRVPLKEGYKEMNGPEDKFEIYLNSIIDLLNSKETLKKTKIFEDAILYIKYLLKNKKKIGVVSSNSKVHFNDTINYFKIDPRIFSVAACSEDTKKHKPHPEPILFALNKIDCLNNKNEVVYIGDAINDMISAENAGIDCVLLDRHNEYLNSNYNRIESLKELIKDE